MNKTIQEKHTDISLFENTPLIRFIVVSLICAVFVIYPNIACFSWDLARLAPDEHIPYIAFFFFRLFFFTVLITVILWYNVKKLKTPSFFDRVLRTALITSIGYLSYVLISVSVRKHIDCFTGLLLFQFFVACALCIFIGHTSHLSSEKRRKEQEIRQLKIENLQSRCDALINQINPHFFFNSLNGLTSLIRKKNDENTLTYVNKLSDVFRYILQSDRKAIVTLAEELEFVQSFRYMMEVRFANKLSYIIDVDPEKRDLKIPVLSLLPLLENIVVHNVIDSEHKMEVRIWLNEIQELVVSSPVFPKISIPETNGTGLKNLENRFSLLMNRQIRIENDNSRFTVYLPLKQG
ncbi:MAG TPA: histidine kinase [Bacteroidales bacterium]|nr:histidine kinase [Bacteroidales bacterium]